MLTAKAQLSLCILSVRSGPLCQLNRNVYTLSREVTQSKWFCLPSEKESSLKGKNLLPRKVDPFSEGTWCAGKQTGSHKSCLPYKKWQKNYQLNRPLNPCPAEPRYTLPLQTVEIQISRLLKKPTDLDLQCLSLCK